MEPRTAADSMFHVKHPTGRIPTRRGARWLFADAKIGENNIQHVFYIHRPDQAP